jgi:hypothetical protein
MAAERGEGRSPDRLFASGQAIDLLLDDHLGQLRDHLPHHLLDDLTRKLGDCFVLAATGRDGRDFLIDGRRHGRHQGRRNGWRRRDRHARRAPDRCWRRHGCRRHRRRCSRHGRRGRRRHDGHARRAPGRRLKSGNTWGRRSGCDRDRRRNPRHSNRWRQARPGHRRPRCRGRNSRGARDLGRPAHGWKAHDGPTASLARRSFRRISRGHVKERGRRPSCRRRGRRGHTGNQ